MRFTTQSIFALNRFYDLFYKNGIKIVPGALNLTPFSLAVWFMDDGSKSGGSIYLNTQQYSVGEQNLLRTFLLDQFGFVTSLNKDKTYFRIRVSKKSALQLCLLISTYIPECMSYKLLI